MCNLCRLTSAQNQMMNLDCTLRHKVQPEDSIFKIALTKNLIQGEFFVELLKLCLEFAYSPQPVGSGPPHRSPITSCCEEDIKVLFSVLIMENCRSVICPFNSFYSLFCFILKSHYDHRLIYFKSVLCGLLIMILPLLAQIKNVSFSMIDSTERQQFIKNSLVLSCGQDFWSRVGLPLLPIIYLFQHSPASIQPLITQT